ncbi:MAG: ATP phosphoribosyltransferase regulatory subunit [Tissierellales bacterium]|nr:ATP phosphoribosyltransferase regulatory subunit [Tissierellales bacterium]MBN2828219.1 ATP phosphoribosyltransferase regulatory subunit [Tissierellales bacterium]
MKFTNIKDELRYAEKRFKLKQDIERMVIEKGYISYEPGMIEDYDKYVAINTRSNRKAIVKVMNANGQISILRPDITSNLLSNLLPKWEKNLKIKIFYYEKIFKHSGSGIKEIRQMGIECLGIETIDADKEVIWLANDILSQYRKKYILEIGSSEYLKGLLQEFYLEEDEYHEVLTLLDRKNKQDLIRFAKGFKKNEAYEALVNLIDLKGGAEEVIEKAKKSYMNERMSKGLNELNEMVKFMKESGLSDNITCDLSMVSSLGYYSGVMLRGYFRESNREIIKGGRYDTYTEQFGEIIPAIGFSVEMDELLKSLYERGEI